LWQIGRLGIGGVLAHIGGMGAGWKFVGVFRRGRKEPLYLECVVAVPSKKQAQLVAKAKLVGADEITATELSRAELGALKLTDGADVFL
jgi:hypothetical protein